MRILITKIKLEFETPALTTSDKLFTRQYGQGLTLAIVIVKTVIPKRRITVT
jgi:hypothetical protein